MKHHDKPVWELSEIPYNKKSFGLLIAIDPVKWDDICKSLTLAKINNYYCPYSVAEYSRGVI